MLEIFYTKVGEALEKTARRNCGYSFKVLKASHFMILKG